MGQTKVENIGNIVPRLFVFGGKRNQFPMEFQENYWLHILENHWSEICGENLAKLCQPQRLEGGKLFVHTFSSTLSNELKLNERRLKTKINQVLEGKWKVNAIYFLAAGEFVHRPKSSEKSQARIAEYRPEGPGECELCHAKLVFPGKICSCCELKNKNILRENIKELLLVQPWLKFEDIQKFYSCNEMLYEEIRSNLVRYYCELVHLGHADEREKLLAVMLFTGRPISEIDDAFFNNVLAYLAKDDMTDYHPVFKRIRKRY